MSAELNTTTGIKPYKVKHSDLPITCPSVDAPAWNAHPRSFIAFDEQGLGSCAYCGNRYQLIEVI